MPENTSPAHDGAKAEYPDAAGYPDGTGTLDEGTSAQAVAEPADEIADFAMSDEEDVDN